MDARTYRGTWLLVGIPLLLAAFTVGRPAPLPPPALPPTFDGGAAAALAAELSLEHPARTAGTAEAEAATRWVRERFRLYGLRARAEPFTARVPGAEPARLVNVVARVPGRSRDVVAVVAHRDNDGRSPGANDNASGTAALLELARARAVGPGPAPGTRAGAPAHTLLFVSTDGGVAGGLGAAELVRREGGAGRVLAVLVLDAVAGDGGLRLVFGGDDARFASPQLVATAAARALEHAGGTPARPSVWRQLLDLAVPFSPYEQAPLVAGGLAAVTLTTGGDRHEQAFDDVPQRLDPGRLETAGRTVEAVIGSLQQGVELDGGGSGYLYVGDRVVPGWAVQLVLVAALLPFFAATVDLFARCRRRRIPLLPAARSLRSRLLFWLWSAGVLLLLAVLGALPRGDGRPPALDAAVAHDWAVTALGLAALGAASGWLVARDRLLPRRPVLDEEVLAGYTVALLGLGVLALVVLALNPYALLLLLPALHAWLWLPNLRRRPAALRFGVLVAGLAGPAAVLLSFGLRYGLGLDAPWYVLTLVSTGYVELPSALVAAACAAPAGQLAALAARRYAPYPGRDERPPLGPIRSLLRAAVLAGRRRRGPQQAAAEG